MSMFLHRQPMRLDRYLANNFKPNLVLDFVRPFYRFNFQRGGAFSDLTFSRTSTATFVDSDGILQTASSGTARVGHHVYEGGQWVNKGLLLESEARTNLFVQSNDFTSGTGAWAGSNTGSLSNDAQGPDGEATSATTLVDSGAGGSSSVNVQEAVTVSTSTTYTYSAFLKADQLSDAILFCLGFTTPSNDGYYFNLADGTIGGAFNTGTGITPRMEDYGNGWYRCSLTFMTDATDTTGTLQIYPVNPGETGSTVDLDGTSSILIYGAQLEEGDTPSSYIPTSGATATRAAESRTTPAAKMFYSATAMSGAFEYLITYADTGTATEQTLFDWRVDANNRITVTLDTAGANTGKITLTVVNGGTSKAISTTADLSPGINVAGKVAWRVTASEVNIALNGTAETAESNTAGVPNLLTADATVGDQIISAFERGWSADIGDAGIQEASA